MRIFFVYCLLLFANCLTAQVINLSYDRQQLLLGEQMVVTLKAYVDKGRALENFPLDTLPHLEILEASKIDTTVINETLQLSQTLTVTSWDSGRWNLPTLITAGTPSKPVTIDVVYTSPWDPNQPYHDIKGIVPVENPGRSTWWWYLIGLAVLIALFLLFFPEGKKDKGVVELDKNAYRKAMESLAKLENERGLDVKSFHTEMITIFRTYLKGAKGIQSFSKTTDDLSIQLQAQRMPPADYNSLVQTLRLSDMVKFAAYRPAEDLNREAVNTIKKSITTMEQGHAV